MFDHRGIRERAVRVANVVGRSQGLSVTATRVGDVAGGGAVGVLSLPLLLGLLRLLGVALHLLAVIPRAVHLRLRAFGLGELRRVAHKPVALRRVAVGAGVRASVHGFKRFGVAHGLCPLSLSWFRRGALALHSLRIVNARQRRAVDVGHALPRLRRLGAGDAFR